MKKCRVVSNDLDNAARYPQRGRLEPTAGKGSLAGPVDVVRTTLLSVRQQSQKSTRTQKSGHYQPASWQPVAPPAARNRLPL